MSQDVDYMCIFIYHDVLTNLFKDNFQETHFKKNWKAKIIFLILKNETKDGKEEDQLLNDVIGPQTLG